MKILKTSLTAFLLFIFAGSTSAAEIEVEWVNPDKYTDIHPASGSKEHFKNRTFKGFEKHFAKLASKLPEGQLLKLIVTNVDLAGDARFSPMQEYRIVKDIYIPRIKFSYELLDSNKVVIESGEANLKDAGFLQTTSRISNQPLKYEIGMINRWFKDTFIEKSES